MKRGRLRGEGRERITKPERIILVRRLFFFHTQLAKMSFDKIFDLIAGVYLYFYNILFSGVGCCSCLRYTRYY